MALVGIASTLRAYKLAWLINQNMALKLSQAEELCFEAPGERAKHVIHFLAETEHSVFRLVKNGLVTSEGTTIAYLIPHLRQFDFLLVVQDLTHTFVPEAFCDALKATQQITYVAPIAEERWLQSYSDLLRPL